VYTGTLVHWNTMSKHPGETEKGMPCETLEFGTVMMSLGQQMSDEDLSLMIAEVDQDSSGTVDFAEFLGLMARQMKDHDRDRVLLNAFNIFDADQTGIIGVAWCQYKRGGYLS